jgi:hypothetical protein
VGKRIEDPKKSTIKKVSAIADSYYLTILDGIKKKDKQI